MKFIKFFLFALLLFIPSFVLAQERHDATFDIRDYGADPRSNVDNATAIQRAIDAACSFANTNIGGGGATGATVYVPAGNWRYSSPLRVNCSNVTVQGEHKTGSRLLTSFRGQAFYVGPAVSVDTAAGITSSGGLGLNFTGTTDTRLYNLRDHPGGDINGSTSFSVRMFYQPRTVPAYDAVIVRSGAEKIAGDTYKTTFNLSQSSSGLLSASIKTSVSTYSVSTSTPVVAGTTYHIAVTWDGSTLRIFKGGTLEGSAATSGTFSQPGYDDFTLGYAPQFWPITGLINNTIDGVVDSFELLNGATYTATYTPPTTKHAQSGNTRLLLNCANNVGNFTDVQSTYGSGWILYHLKNLLLSSISSTNLEKLFFQGGGGASCGPFIRSIQNSHFDELFINFARNGIQLFDNSYQDRVRGCIITLQQHSASGSHPRFGLVFNGAAGISRVDEIHVTGGTFPIFLGAGSAGQLDHCFIETQATTLWGLTLKNDSGGSDSYVINNLVINNESGGQPVEYPVMMSTNRSVIFNGGVFYFFGATPALACFAINGGGAIQINAPSLNFSVGTIPEIVTVLSPPTFPVILIAPDNFNGFNLTNSPTSVIQVAGPITDNFASIKGSADGSKQLRHEVDGFTAGTTRIATWPDANITVAGTNFAQTWTANQTFGSDLLRATSPRITTSITDTVGATWIGQSANASAVNYFNIANAATGNGPLLTAVGTDTNIPLTLGSKGTGALNFQTNNVTKAILNNNGTLQILAGDGASAVYKRAKGSYVTFFTNATTSGTGETDLFSKTIEANVLGTVGDYVTWHIVGVFSNDSGNKTLRLYFGGTNYFTVTGTGANFQNIGWYMTLVAQRVASDTIKITGIFNAPTASYVSGNTSQTIRTAFGSLNFAGTLVCKLTGEAAAGSITAEHGILEKADNP